MRLALPLSRRPLDAALVAFLAVDLLSATHVVRLEQIVIDDPSRSTPLLLPPEPLAALVHRWGPFHSGAAAAPGWDRAERLRSVPALLPWPRWRR